MTSSSGSEQGEVTEQRGEGLAPVFGRAEGTSTCAGTSGLSILENDQDGLFERGVERGWMQGCKLESHLVLVMLLFHHITH